MAPLDTNQILRLASRYDLEFVVLNETSKVISFRSDEGVRFNIYYTTGTVATCLDHPRQGRTQLFRRNVDIHLLEQIFENPRVHTDLGYQQLQHRRQRTNHHDDDTDETTTITLAEEEAAIHQLKILCNERNAIDKEIHRVNEILLHFEQQREQERLKAQEEERRRQAERAAEERRLAKEKLRMEREERGLYGFWSLNDSSFFQECFQKSTTSVALGDDCFILLYDDGTWAYSSGLPKDIINLLKGRAASHPAPKMVSLGDQGRYYINFQNGKSQWVGPSEMSNILQVDSRSVRSVAFGEDWETFFIVWDDGDYNWSGDIPSGLQDLLDRRRRRCDLDFVRLGPNGEWALFAQNGKAWWDGISRTSFKQTFKQIDEYGDRVTDICFGSYHTFFVRYQ